MRLQYWADNEKVCVQSTGYYQPNIIQQWTFILSLWSYLVDVDEIAILGWNWTGFCTINWVLPAQYNSTMNFHIIILELSGRCRWDYIIGLILNSTINMGLPAQSCFTKCLTIIYVELSGRHRWDCNIGLILNRFVYYQLGIIRPM